MSQSDEMGEVNIMRRCGRLIRDRGMYGDRSTLYVEQSILFEVGARDI